MTMRTTLFFATVTVALLLLLLQLGTGGKPAMPFLTAVHAQCQVCVTYPGACTGSTIDLTGLTAITSLTTTMFRPVLDCNVYSTIILHSNAFTTVPANIFDGVSVSNLYIHFQPSLVSLQDNAFSGFSCNTYHLNDNPLLSTITDNAFNNSRINSGVNLQRCPSLTGLLPDSFTNTFNSLGFYVKLNQSPITSLPAYTFRGSAMDEIDLTGTPLTTLDPLVFSGQRGMYRIVLENMPNLIALPPNLFDGLEVGEFRLRRCHALASLPANLFNGATYDILDANVYIQWNNALTSLPAGLFNGWVRPSAFREIKFFYIEHNPSLVTLESNSVAGLRVTDTMRIANNSALANIGTAAFNNTETPMLLLEDLPSLTSLAGSPFQGKIGQDNVLRRVGLTSLASDAFQNMVGFISLLIDDCDALATFSPNQFSGSSFGSVTIINSDAFQTFPTGWTTGWVTSNSRLYLEQNSNLQTIPAAAIGGFAGDEGLRYFSVRICPSLADIGEGIFNYPRIVSGIELYALDALDFGGTGTLSANFFSGLVMDSTFGTITFSFMLLITSIEANAFQNLQAERILMQGLRVRQLVAGTFNNVHLRTYLQLSNWAGAGDLVFQAGAFNEVYVDQLQFTYSDFLTMPKNLLAGVHGYNTNPMSLLDIRGEQFGVGYQCVPVSDPCALNTSDVLEGITTVTTDCPINEIIEDVACVTPPLVSSSSTGAPSSTASSSSTAPSSSTGAPSSTASSSSTAPSSSTGAPSSTASSSSTAPSSSTGAPSSTASSSSTAPSSSTGAPSSTGASSSGGSSTGANAAPGPRTNFAVGQGLVIGTAVLACMAIIMQE